MTDNAPVRSILLALADPSARDELEAQLNGLGSFRIASAFSGEATRRQARVIRPDLLFLSDDLPDSNPLQLTSQLLAQQPTLAIVLLTAQLPERLPREAIRLGLVDWLSLPVKPDDLQTAVERGLERGRHWREWLKLESARYTGTLVKQVDELTSVLTEIKDGVLILDGQQRIVLLNHTVRRAFGLADIDYTGHPLNDVISHEGLHHALNERADQADELFGNPEVLGADQRTYSVHLSDVEGVGLVATLHDVSYLKELDRVKSEFVNMVSHDLRSPLTAIMGYIDLLPKTGSLNQQQAEFIDRTRDSVKNITIMVSDLLQLGKLETGLNEDMQTIDLAALIEVTVFPLRQRAELRAQALGLDLPADLPAIHGNPIQLRQVFDNLVNNAVKYTPEGGIITIHGEVKDEQLIIYVRDNGPGIPASEQAKVFDRFYRATNVPDNVQGTGLGLHITRTIVEQHNGRIWLQSSNNGTTFAVMFPISE